MTRNERDPMLPRDSDKCRCATCGLYFNSTHAFDRHRVLDSADARRFKDYARRRCLSGIEMRERGMTTSATGHWITAPRPPVSRS